MTETLEKGSQISNEDDSETPECLKMLEPHNDLYSSDGENIMIDKVKDDTKPARKKRKSEKAVKLPIHCRSSDWSGVEVLFFFDLDYIRYPSKPLDLTGSSVEHILGTMFSFIFPGNSQDKQDNDDGNNKPINLKDNTVADILKNTLLEHPELVWMRENDRLNFKNCSSKAIEEQKKCFYQMRKNRPADVCDNVKHIISFLETLIIQYTQNGLNDSQSVRTIFPYLYPLMPWQTGQKFAEETKCQINYMVSEDIASDVSPSNKGSVFTEGVRLCQIEVCPDVVYEAEADRIPVIAVQVFAHPEENPETAGKNEDSKRKFSQCNNNPDDIHPKPQCNKDAIVKENYQKEANRFLKQFVFHDCSDSVTMNKILGEHIVQLVALALQRLYREREPDKLVVGIFMKNEYLYFSKLCINDAKLRSYNPPVTPVSWDDRLSEVGEVTFANWRIDLTLPAHRMALVVFLINFVGNFKQLPVC